MGGALALAASAGTAQAANDYDCIGVGASDPAVDNVAHGVDFNVTDSGDFPDVVVGQPFTVTPTVQYNLGNAYLQQLVDAGVLSDAAGGGPTEHKLGGITFWVGIRATNTVEERQIMRAVVNPGQSPRVLYDADTSEVWVQRYANAGTSQAPNWQPTGAPTPNLAGTANLNATGIQWTPKSGAPVSFSVAPAGTLGSIPVQAQWRRNSPLAAAPIDTIVSGNPAGVPDVDPLVSTRPYGSALIRLRLGQERTSLDCAPGSVTIANDEIPYSESGNLAPVDGGDTGRYLVLAASPAPFSTTSPELAPRRFQCIDGLGRYLNREINGYAFTLRTGDPGTYAAGRPYALTGTKLDATINAAMIKGLYATLYRYQQLPAAGNLDQPLAIWIALQGANTAEGVQVVKVEGRWQARFSDPDGIVGSGDEVFPEASVTLDVPQTTWTPTGGGPVAFSVAAPGQIPELTLTGRGHSGDAGAIFPMYPYGSLFVRADTGRYGASIDCVEGSIRIADVNVAFSNLGRRSAAERISTPVPAGQPPASTTVPSGSAGRYAITHAPSAPFAVVPAATAPPAAPAPVAAAAKLASKRLAVAKSRIPVAISCPATSAAACTGRVQVGTDGRYKLGKGARKRVAMTRTASYRVAPGKRATLKLRVSDAGKALLAQRKRTKLAVRVVVRPAGAAPVMSKLTLRG